MIFIRVDLPAPFSARTAWIGRCATLTLTRPLAFTAGYCSLMSASSRRMADSAGRSGGLKAAMAALAGDQRFDQVAFVAKRHPCEDPLMQCAGHVVPPARDRADRRIPDADVGHRA